MDGAQGFIYKNYNRVRPDKVVRDIVEQTYKITLALVQRSSST